MKKRGSKRPPAACDGSGERNIRTAPASERAGCVSRVPRAAALGSQQLAARARATGRAAGESSGSRAFAAGPGTVGGGSTNERATFQ